MKKRVTISTRAARSVYSSDAFQFVKSILKKFCNYDVPEEPFKERKKEEQYAWTNEVRLYGTKSKGIKQHNHSEVVGRSVQTSISTNIYESFGFPNLSIRFVLSTRDGLILELEAEEQSLLKEIMNLFEEQFGYCRKQSQEEIFDELVYELRTRFTENNGLYGIELGLKAIEMNPDDFWARFFLGCAYGVNGQYEKAKEHLFIAIEKKPDNYDALYNLGLVYFFTNDLEQAEETMLRARALDEDNHVIIYHLGKLYEKMGNNDEAIKYYQRAIETAPENAPWYIHRAKSFLKEAEEALSRLKKLA